MAILGTVLFVFSSKYFMGKSAPAMANNGGFESDDIVAANVIDDADTSEE
jgi:hypothetical protein